MTLSLDIRTIPHQSQRYDTAGDWYGNSVRISDCRNRKYEWLLAIHELVEMALCETNGVTEHDVDAFDKTYRGKTEPGDSPRSPYRREHCFATAVERMLCAAMGVNWKEYDDFVGKL